METASLKRMIEDEVMEMEGSMMSLQLDVLTVSNLVADQLLEELLKELVDESC